MAKLRSLALFITIFFLSAQHIYAQQIGAKDCIDAVQLLNWQTVFYANTPGEGDVLNEIDNTSSCLNSGESNSSWFIFYTTSSGIISFNIIPTCDNADYDFAVFDITEYGCEGIALQPEIQVSCNFSGSTFPTSVTGANGGNNPQDEEVIQAQAGRVYVLLVNNFSGANMCHYSINFSGSTAQLGRFNEIMGRVHYDSNDICGDGIETPVQNQRVIVTNENDALIGYAYSEPDGFYKAFIDSGQATVRVSLENVAIPFEPSCFPAQQQVVFTSDMAQVVSNIDFALRASEICSQYNFEYTVPLFRRCFKTTSTVQISNLGSESSELDFVLRYPTDQIYPVSASVPFESIGNNTYLFHAPPFEPMHQLFVFIQDTSTCENLLGSLVCVEGELLEPNTCQNEEISSLKLVLFNDTTINHIVVKNFGEDPMPNSFSLYIGSEFDTINNMFASSNEYFMQLQPGESFSAGVFSEFWTAALIDDFGNKESIFISNVPNSTLTDTLFDLSINNWSAHCAEIVGSYDPNDKQGFPEGFGELNRIEANQSIRYRIRFQNTGSDTAFTVVVRDTLSEYLDHSSIIPGASSHQYLFYIENNKLEFRFNQINLVQKSLNEPASIGFVEFRVKQKANNPISYTIENQAAIYFDFNEPIYTPVHKYAIYPLPLGVQNAEQAEIYASPNPSRGSISFNFTQKWQGAQKTFLVSDLSGRVIKEIQSSEDNPSFEWQDLPSGTYIITILADKGLRTTMRWIKI